MHVCRHDWPVDLERICMTCTTFSKSSSSCCCGSSTGSRSGSSSSSSSSTDDLAPAPVAQAAPGRQVR